MRRVLIASPVRQEPPILTAFLAALARLETSGLEIEYAFIDDEEKGGCRLLWEFAAARGDIHILPGEPHGPYIRDEEAHHWPEELVWKVADYKNRLIALALAGSFDWLFLVDTDVVLHPQTLVHLIGLRKEIVAEVMWTSFHPGELPLPSVWLASPYRLHAWHWGEELDREEIAQRGLEFLRTLWQPGVYKVGGLAACTLFSRGALSLGLSFARIYNLDFWGEDRHLSIRAAALGLELYADTHYPPYHIYRLAELSGLESHKRRFSDWP